MIFIELLLIGLAIASLTMTLSKSNVTEYLRDSISRLGSWPKKLIHCPYCLSHYFAFGFVWWKFGLLPLENFILMSFGVITIASLASLGIAQFFLALEDLE